MFQNCCVGQRFGIITLNKTRNNNSKKLLHLAIWELNVICQNGEQWPPKIGKGGREEKKIGNGHLHSQIKLWCSQQRNGRLLYIVWRRHRRSRRDPTRKDCQGEENTNHHDVFMNTVYLNWNTTLSPVVCTIDVRELIANWTPMQRKPRSVNQGSFLVIFSSHTHLSNTLFPHPWLFTTLVHVCKSVLQKHWTHGKLSASAS